MIVLLTKSEIGLDACKVGGNVEELKSVPASSSATFLSMSEGLVEVAAIAAMSPFAAVAAATNLRDYLNTVTTLLPGGG